MGVRNEGTLFWFRSAEAGCYINIQLEKEVIKKKNEKKSSLQSVWDYYYHSGIKCTQYSIAGKRRTRTRNAVF